MTSVNMTKSGQRSIGSNLRLIVPYLRGFGPAQDVSDAVVRSGQQAALGVGIVAMLDALQIDKAFLVDYD